MTIIELKNHLDRLVALGHGEKEALIAQSSWQDTDKIEGFDLISVKDSVLICTWDGEVIKIF